MAVMFRMAKGDGELQRVEVQAVANWNGFPSVQEAIAASSYHTTLPMSKILLSPSQRLQN